MTKTEEYPKSEIPSPKAETRFRTGLAVATLLASGKLFELRDSGFGLLSAFGFRTSDF